MEKVRGKMVCHSNNKGQINMGAVYSADPDHENKVFSDATPAASVNMLIENASAAAFFEPGEEYYMDFTLVPETKPVDAG
ncbi:MAG: hypothetical protein KAV87_55520 [Desulfobacteraceae bacterium]|nr:hypothetical protein [Desulfobacteraceae bacterium]